MGEARTGHQTLHMLAAEDWQRAQGVGLVAPASLASDGFVHCTDGREELADVANRYYSKHQYRILWIYHQ